MAHDITGHASGSVDLAQAPAIAASIQWLSFQGGEMSENHSKIVESAVYWTYLPAARLVIHCTLLKSHGASVAAAFVQDYELAIERAVLAHLKPGSNDIRRRP